MSSLFDISAYTCINLDEISSISVGYNAHSINGTPYPYEYKVWGECYIKVKNGDNFTLDNIENIHNFLINGVNKKSLWNNLVERLKSRLDERHFLEEEVNSFISSL